MALNFSEWKDSLREPQYQIEGKRPKCKGGYKWDKELKTCVPDTKNGENPGEKEIPEAMLGYEIYGSTGLNGDGYAVEVDEMYTPTEKDRRKDAEAAKAHKEQDDRMRYGKKSKEKHEAEALRPGEVKRWDDIEKRWVSNKEGK